MDRESRERAAVAAAGLAPVPYTRTTPADVAGCEGFTNSVSRRSPGLCYRCERFGHAGRSYIAPALTLKNGEASCPNWRPLLSAAQVAAVDEQAGLHATHCAPAGGGEKSLHQQSVDSTTTEGAGS